MGKLVRDAISLAAAKHTQKPQQRNKVPKTYLLGVQMRYVILQSSWEYATVILVIIVEAPTVA